MVELANHGSRRLSLVAFALAGLLVAALGIALTLTRGIDPAEAAVQEIRVLGEGYLRQDASQGGNRNSLLSLNSGALQHRSVCTALGGGTVRVDVQIRSDKTGGMVMTKGGWLVLGPSFQNLWAAQGTGPVGFAEGYEVLYKDGTYRHFELSFAVKHGRDCVTHIVATTT